MADRKVRVCDIQDTHGDLVLAEERRLVVLDGQRWVLDLCTEHNEAFQKTMNPYVDSATRLGGRRRRHRSA